MQAEQLKDIIHQLSLMLGGTKRLNLLMKQPVMHSPPRHNMQHIPVLALQGESIKANPHVDAVKCWEVKNCPVERRNSCPAYPDEGNRCWMVTGTMCGGKEQGSWAHKLDKCQQCDVYKKVLMGRIPKTEH